MPLEEAEASGSGELASLSGGIAWRPALQVSLLLALPAGLLSYSLTPLLALVWIMGAASWAVVLYAKRVRAGKISLGNGARIGLITGLFTAWLSLGVNGVGLWVNRFLRHEGGEFDSALANALQSGFESNSQVAAQAGLTSAQAAEVVQKGQWLHALALSPEGRAGIVLGIFLILGAILVLLATIGGIVGARYLTPARRPSS
jgi:hypothetical protein